MVRNRRNTLFVPFALITILTFSITTGCTTYRPVAETDIKANEAQNLTNKWVRFYAGGEEYAAGEREQPAKMKEKMDLLSADDETALLHYYASQQ